MTDTSLFAEIAKQGIVAMAFAAILAVVVQPMLKAMFRQQELSLDLLRKSVDALQEAVCTFKRFEESERDAYEKIVATQREILNKLPARP